MSEERAIDVESSRVIRRPIRKLDFHRVACPNRFRKIKHRDIEATAKSVIVPAQQSNTQYAFRATHGLAKIMADLSSSGSEIARDRDLISQLNSQFSTPKRLAVIGSLSFSHPATERICQTIGQQLAELHDLIVLTGGVSGIPETVSRSLWQQRKIVSTGGASVYHVQPKGFEPWDYGETVTAGATMAARRQILATLAPLYLLLEGGFGSEQETTLALHHGALMIPVGCTGGVAGSLWQKFNEKCGDRLASWTPADRSAWANLGRADLDAGTIAQSATTLVRRSMHLQG